MKTIVPVTHVPKYKPLFIQKQIEGGVLNWHQILYFINYTGDDTPHTLRLPTDSTYKKTVTL